MADHIYRYRDLCGAGISRRRIRTIVERGGAVRVVRGVYADGPAGPMRDVRALFARLPGGTVLGYQTAAAMYGFGPPAEGLHVIIPAGTVRPRIRGVVCHEAVGPVESPLLFDGVPCAPPARCAVDLARTTSRMDGLALLDASLRTGACTTADLADEVARHAAFAACAGPANWSASPTGGPSARRRVISD